jgi:hypothetical protein
VRFCCIERNRRALTLCRAVVPAVYGGGTAAWSEVMPHLMQRLAWTEPSFHAETLTCDALVAPGAAGDEARAAFWRAVADVDMVVFVGVSDDAHAAFLAKHSAHVPCVVAFACCDALADAARLHFQPASALLAALASTLPWGRSNRDALLLENARELFARHTPSDFVFALLLLLDGVVAPVRTLTVNRRTTPANLACMLRNCGSEVAACVSDPRCKAALDCLEACGLNDQVCSYRCITSFESPRFEAFALCNLQLHNCLGNHAERPLLPATAPMAAFRGAPLTHETAEALLTGWLATPGTLADAGQTLQWSWKVVAGQNPAYDYFPAQHQIFYRGKGKSFWYDPVFKVRLFDGAWEWRRRHYRVKRQAEPGRFVFSVLDNGVTSLEHWTVVDVADDLSWGLFAYSGAASAAGQAYGGAVFATPDGAWPPAEQLARVREAHAACGIKMWELHEVDNSPEVSAGAPLQLFDQ